MKRACAALVFLTLLSGLSMSSFAQNRQRNRGAVFIGSGVKTGAEVNTKSHDQHDRGHLSSHRISMRNRDRNRGSA